METASKNYEVDIVEHGIGRHLEHNQLYDESWSKEHIRSTNIQHATTKFGHGNDFQNHINYSARRGLGDENYK